MGELFYQLGRCFAFRQISHPQMVWITWRFPLGLTAAISIVFISLPAKPNLFGDAGFNGSVMSVVAMLPGFFIAALAAVSTFQRETLDDTMAAPAPRLSLRTRGQDEAVDLTTRMFLSHLFAYLTAYSFVLILFCLTCEALAPSMHVWTSCIPALGFPLRLIYIAMVGWLFGNIVITTLFGMYFLAERMQRPNA